MKSTHWIEKQHSNLWWQLGCEEPAPPARVLLRSISASASVGSCGLHLDTPPSVPPTRLKGSLRTVFNFSNKSYCRFGSKRNGSEHTVTADFFFFRYAIQKICCTSHNDSGARFFPLLAFQWFEPSLIFIGVFSKWCRFRCDIRIRKTLGIIDIAESDSQKVPVGIECIFKVFSLYKWRSLMKFSILTSRSRTPQTHFHGWVRFCGVLYVAIL